jgi:hypothetical protein
VVPISFTLWLPLGTPHRVLASKRGGSVGDIPLERIVDALDDLLRESGNEGGAVR